MLFTFQYVPICFYYFSFYDTITDFVSKIYIPICFYYFSAVPEGSAVYGNLHSNMFLLFLCSHFSRSTFNHIYIPICFYYFTISPSERYNSDMHLHSNMFLLFLTSNLIKSLLDFIYIPICFYYFQDEHIFIENGISFTFQYVSIISVQSQELLPM